MGSASGLLGDTIGKLNLMLQSGKFDLGASRLVYLMLKDLWPLSAFRGLEAHVLSDSLRCIRFRHNLLDNEEQIRGIVTSFVCCMGQPAARRECPSKPGMGPLVFPGCICGRSEGGEGGGSL